MFIGTAIICLAATWFFIRWNFANAVATRIDLRQPDSRRVVDWLVEMAPADPQTHFVAALFLEKTFDPGDLDRSLNEYELAVSLSPFNYYLWQNLAKARNLNGDTTGAEAAYKKALELAPNYAAVQWVVGNFLLRQGNTDEGFALAAQAAAADPVFSPAAVSTALQIFDGNVVEVRCVLGDSETTNAALTTALAAAERFDESYEAWAKLPAQNRSTEQIKLGEALAEKMAAANKFRLASRITADLQTVDTVKPVIGQMANGSFENEVKQKGANRFEWRIAEGGEPQIGLSDSQKRSGKFGLFILFNTIQSKDFRTISQTVAVEPGARYELEMFYRADLTTAAVFKWEVADAATTAAIASTPPMILAGDWAILKTVFTVPDTVDGIIVRLVREGCGGPACRVSGRLSFDDIALRRL